MSSLSQTRRVPEDPAARLMWDRGFEAHLACLYPEHNPAANFYKRITTMLEDSRLAVQSGHAARETIMRTLDLCSYQLRLSVDALEYLCAKDLEEKWENTSHSRREDVAREAILITCSKVEFYSHRPFCPEMTVKNFSQQFLPLLKKFTTGDAVWRVHNHSPYDKPILFDDHRIEQYIQPPEAHRVELEP